VDQDLDLQRSEGLASDLARRVERVLLTLRDRKGALCRCDKVLCSHEVLISYALGYGDAPFCLPCLSMELRKPAGILRDEVAAYIASKPCLTTGWRWAQLQEGLAPSVRPPCLWEAAVPPAESSSIWDAGDMGCGDLVLELRIRLQALSSGGVLRLVARDPGAPEDLPAWCRMTGHTLLQASHPEYLIQRRKEG